jgi:hypothetical protein
VSFQKVLKWDFAEEEVQESQNAPFQNRNLSKSHSTAQERVSQGLSSSYQIQRGGPGACLCCLKEMECEKSGGESVYRVVQKESLALLGVT